MLRQVLVFDNAAELAEAFAAQIQRAAGEALSARGCFHMALTGGSSARLYAGLRGLAIDWSRVHLWWGDERAVPPDDAESNYHLAQQMLFAHVPVPPPNLHRMPADDPDPKAAARAYAESLPASLDIIHLGMGPDGHVCSLFPGHPLLGEREHRAAWLADAPKPPPARMTLLLPTLWAAGALVVTVSGGEKAGAVKTVLERPDAELPAALATSGPAPADWLLDTAAAAELPFGRPQAG
jgi:6-phosphogluconolactonase